MVNDAILTTAFVFFFRLAVAQEQQPSPTRNWNYQPGFLAVQTKNHFNQKNTPKKWYYNSSFSPFLSPLLKKTGDFVFSSVEICSGDLRWFLQWCIKRLGTTAVSWAVWCCSGILCADTKSHHVWVLKRDGGSGRWRGLFSDVFFGFGVKCRDWGYYANIMCINMYIYIYLLYNIHGLWEKILESLWVFN